MLTSTHPNANLMSLIACLQAKEDPETREDMEAIGGVEQRHITVEEAQVC